MYGSAVWFIGLSRGIGSHVYYRGAPRYTMLAFGFTSLCSLRWYIRERESDVTIVYKVFTYLL